MSKITAEIIERFKRGDVALIAEIKKRVYYNFQNYIMRNNGTEADAEDLFQDGLIKFYNECLKPKFKPDQSKSLYGYIFRICKRLWIDKHRSKKTATLNWIALGDKEINAYIEQLKADEQSDPQYQLFIDDIRELVKNNINRLSKKCQTFLYLRYYKDLDNAEISHQLGVKGNTPRKQKFDCKKKLINALQPYLQDLSQTYPFLLKYIEQSKRSNQN